jgi:hypothetical protein
MKVKLRLKILKEGLLILATMGVEFLLLGMPERRASLLPVVQTRRYICNHIPEDYYHVRQCAAL